MILDDIVTHKKKVLPQHKAAMPPSRLEKLVGAADPPRGFMAALKNGPGIAFICEIKKSSPSAGVIRKDFDAVEIGRIYESSGASAISVLTEKHFFDGSLARLQKVRDAVGVPVLRKDFIIDPFQIYEARAAGADAILLIVAILSDEKLKALIHLAKELGMDPLVEAHTAEELDRALESGARIIGINNRDLKTFHVDLNTTLDLMTRIPEDMLCVSESGIKSHDDIKRLSAAGVDAVLVGTTLMQAGNIGAKLRSLVGDHGKQ